MLDDMSPSGGLFVNLNELILEGVEFSSSAILKDIQPDVEVDIQPNSPSDKIEPMVLNRARRRVPLHDPTKVSSGFPDSRPVTVSSDTNDMCTNSFLKILAGAGIFMVVSRCLYRCWCRFF